MNEQNNIGTKIIGGLVAAVAVWGIWQVLKMTDAPKKNLDGVDSVIDSEISGKYNINRYGNKGHEIISNSGKVLKVFNSKADDDANWKDAVAWGSKNLKKIKK